MVGRECHSRLSLLWRHFLPLSSTPRRPQLARPPRMAASSESTSDISAHIAVPSLGLLLLLQYGTLFSATFTIPTDSPLCKPSVYGFAYRGWDAGVCLTEEQVWCRVHPGRRSACATADCRAEEIRLSVWRSRGDDWNPSRRPAYPDSTRCTGEIVDHIRALSTCGDNCFESCGPCAPPDDRRAAFLPNCTETQAACRGLYYRPRDERSAQSTWRCPEQPRNYHAASQRLAGAAEENYGCPQPPQSLDPSMNRIR